MPVKMGRVVLNHVGDHRYKVVFDHEPAGTSEHLVRSVAEGEALIRERMQLAPEVRHGGPEWHL